MSAVGDVGDVEAPPLPEPYQCEPGTVPGWLNEDGLPTGCVGDLPDPGAPVFTAEPAPVFTAEPAPVFTAEPAPVESTTALEAPIGVGGIQSLPETGSEPALLIALLIGIAAGALGVALLRRESGKGGRS